MEKINKKQLLDKGISILEYPNRTVNNLLEKVINHNIPVLLAKNGYYIAGFYGINHGQEGYLFIQDTSDSKTLIAHDHKNNLHIITNFEDLVILNNFIWKHFYKAEPLKYNKPDNFWFSFMLEKSILTISPGK